NAAKPAEVDDGRVDLAVAAHDDIDDPSHVLPGAAAHALAEDRGDLLIVENHRRGAGRGGRWRGRSRWRISRFRLLRRRRRLLRRLRELPRLSRSRSSLRQPRPHGMEPGCRDQRDRGHNGKYWTDTHQVLSPRTRQPATSTRMRRDSSSDAENSIQHRFLNEIPISLPRLPSRKHMAGRANLPQDVLSLDHEIAVGGRYWDESNALECGAGPCRRRSEGMESCGAYLPNDAG